MIDEVHCGGVFRRLKGPCCARRSGRVKLGEHSSPLQQVNMHKPRLHRLQWLFTDCPVYFVTSCTHQRRRLLDQDFVHEAFVSFCQQAADRGVLVGRYVLMPDHIHLFVVFAPHAPRPSTWVQSLKVFLAKTLRQHGHGGTHWQKGFFDHVLRSSESYAEKWQYVKENPVRAGLVNQANDWPYQGEVGRADL